MSILYTMATSMAMLVIYPLGRFLALIGRPWLADRTKTPSTPASQGAPRLWIHAASVGEAGIACAVAAEVKRVAPASLVFISTVTASGLERVRSLAHAEGDSIIDASFLAPLDAPFITERFVRVIAPTALVLVETELWPALIQSVASRGIPIGVVNGRLGRRSFRRYRVFRSVVGNPAHRLSLVCVQSRAYARRFKMLGVPEDRIEILGNLKLDMNPGLDSFDAVEERCRLDIPEDAFVVVAGSTRPGEEALILDAFSVLKLAVPSAVLVLAPRHLTRLDDIERLLRDRDIPAVTRTSGKTLAEAGASVFILNTLGELQRAYACADVAFVGGSLCPFGGHNPLEPAGLGKPILFGRYMEQVGARELLERGAARMVTETDLAKTLLMLAEDSEARWRMGEQGAEMVRAMKGALARTVESLAERGFLGDEAGERQ